MSIQDKLLKAAAGAAPGGLVPSEHFGVVLYEGDGSSSHSINGGKFGAAFDGNGSSSYIDLPSFSSIVSGSSANFSVSLWINLNNLTGSNTLFQLSGNDTAYTHLTLQVNSSGNFAIDNYGAAYTFSGLSSISANTWYHLVLVNTGSSAVLYVNNSASSALNHNTTFAGTYSAIGGRFVTGSIFSDDVTEGKIDQFRVFTKALSSSEVSTLYAETLATSTSLDPLSEDTTDTLQVLGDSSCIATYRFENDEVDLSGNYDLTGNAIQYAAGRYGQAASFNGSSSYAEITSSPPQDSSGVMSVSFWAKTSSTSRVCFFIAEAPDPNKEFLKLENFGYQGTNSFRVSYDNNMLSNIDNVAISDGQWHHIVITAGNGNVKTYKDNSLLATQSVTITDRTLDNFVIGYRKYNNDLYFNGEIDQFRIFNKELSASEVTTLYQENSLVASYRFEGNANDDTRNYDGTASNVTYEYGLNFTPDFIWTKSRTNTNSHALYDSTRGVNKELNSNSTDAQGSLTDGISSFDTGGFTVGARANSNQDGQDFVAWAFKAKGGTTSSNTDGTITSTVQVNQDAGFSIVQYTGTGANGSVGHGLGVKPDFVVIKHTNDASAWVVFSDATGTFSYSYLNLTSAFTAYSAMSYDSSVLNLNGGNDQNGAGDTHIAYFFASKEGFSKIGSYTGTGAAGNLIETGFEPAFIIIKRSNSTGGWLIFDNKRNLTNPRNSRLEANSSQAEQAGSTSKFVDFYSNGFEPQVSDSEINASGGTFIYMAFAADPDTEAPTVAKSFSTVTYTGNQTARSIDGFGFQPNLVWIKDRSDAYGHFIFDSIRGPLNRLESNANYAAANVSDTLTSFDSDGFSTGNSFYTNKTGDNFVAWSWKADDNEETIEEVTEDADAVAIYELNQNANDALGNYNGTVTGTANWTSSGKFNYAAEFDSWHINTGHNFSLANNSFSISFWFANSATGSTNSYVISTDGPETQNNHLLIGRRDSNGKLNFAFYANDLNSATDVTTDGTWQHWVCTYNASTNSRKIYLNGSLDASDTASADYQGTSNLEIGFGIYQGLGKVDQVRIYNKELNTASVINLYNETTSQTSTANIGTKTTISLEAIVSANANAGFSIVKWTGTGAINKVPHGLSAAPEMILIKDLDSASDWQVYHTSIGNGDKLVLNTTAAASSTTRWDSTSPTATVFTLRDIGLEGELIAYCFHSVSGFSKFGSYTGNGGTLSVNVGFAADFVMVKASSRTSNWYIFDSVRGDYNRLFPDLSNAESTSTNQISLTSTGFTSGNGGTNLSGETFIYMAFKIN